MMLDWLFAAGPLGPVLGVMALIAAAIALERGLALGAHRVPRSLEREAALDLPGLVPGWATAGFTSMLRHEAHARTVREEEAGMWLAGLDRDLRRGIGLLRLIALLAPMVGLLGTVIGMILAFRTIAAQSGPVTPTLLADGLWQAMLTTAIGLAIALPAQLVVAVLTACVETRVTRLATLLTRLSHALDENGSKRRAATGPALGSAA